MFPTQRRTSGPPHPALAAPVSGARGTCGLGAPPGHTQMTWAPLGRDFSGVLTDAAVKPPSVISETVWQQRSPRQHFISSAMKT